ncbi:Phosphoglucomutase-3 [Cichlidogyrus casuarinus]|uniref:Phosphoacetylglucosamine mutase n=1 Tax=Cichlidogyrus casuarinus TaxID=1844966 RepID=A0ABD2QP99_9PLAT
MIERPKLEALLASHPLAEASRSLEYGTAGFRAKANMLKGVTARCGLLAALRSISQLGKCIGVMITASHNPASDNGVKIIEPDGSMLIPEWENLAVQFVKADSPSLFALIEKELKKCHDVQSKPLVFIAHDTRASSCDLSAEVVQGIQAMNGSWKHLNLLTTPQLHFLVQKYNDGVFQEPNSDIYVHQFCEIFAKTQHNKTSSILHIDCANGVGFSTFSQMNSIFNESGINYFKLFNTLIDQNDKLNLECGADFVVVSVPFVKVHLTKTARKSCRLYDQVDGFSIGPNQRWASFDGDADRLIYWFIDENSGQLHLLDGNHLAVLYATFLCDQLKQNSIDLKCAVVQTAYANSASTHYIERTLGLDVVCTKTGVKHLHHAALEFDFGIYFESNGHGTITVSKKAQDIIKSNLPDDHELALFCSLINTSVGDAIADLLLAEFVLTRLDWTLEKWFALYTEYPSRLSKIEVKDRTLIETCDAERRVSKPESLQRKIDSLIAEARAFEKKEVARAFVRPSGTENMVRVYAEASTKYVVDWLSDMVLYSVHELAAGYGDLPALPKPL